MKLHTKLFSVLLGLVLLACTPKAPAIEVMSGDFDLNPLVGQWQGTYRNTETGRVGTIAFTLRAGETAAFGRVIMLPHSADSAAAANADPAALSTSLNETGRQALTISFVRKEGGKLIGTLDPYMDPDCKCTVNTSFAGSFVDAATIEGTFTTAGPASDRAPTHGTWKVIRLRRL
jgi:hypothetical protein